MYVPSLTSEERGNYFMFGKPFSCGKDTLLHQSEEALGYFRSSASGKRSGDLYPGV
jgi:hypothetical protein